MWKSFPLYGFVLKKSRLSCMFKNVLVVSYSVYYKHFPLRLNTVLCASFKQLHKNDWVSFQLHNIKHLRISCAHCVKARNDLGDHPKTAMEKLVSKMPLALQPYLKLMRIHKPIGTYLLLWPCFWSLGMATPANTFPNLGLLSVFGCGALLMRGAGCTINDMWDRDIDAEVARTKSRPLASGEISMLDAIMFLGGQLSLALLILLQLNWYSILLGSSSLGLVVIYPLVKRISYWPQLVLGLTFNWGAMLGWAALHGSCTWSVVLPLYFACISWTLIYDTIYAYQDKVDDVIIKVKSTAIKFGDDCKRWLSYFSSSMITCLLVTGYNAGQTWPYYASVGITSLLLCSQICSLDTNNPEDCWKKFKSNQHIGWIIFGGIVGGTIMKTSSDDSQNMKRSGFVTDYLKESHELPRQKVLSVVLIDNDM